MVTIRTHIIQISITLLWLNYLVCASLFSLFKHSVMRFSTNWIPPPISLWRPVRLSPRRDWSLIWHRSRPHMPHAEPERKTPGSGKYSGVGWKRKHSVEFARTQAPDSEMILLTGSRSHEMAAVVQFTIKSFERRGCCKATEVHLILRQVQTHEMERALTN